MLLVSASSLHDIVINLNIIIRPRGLANKVLLVCIHIVTEADAGSTHTRYSLALLMTDKGVGGAVLTD